LEFNVPFQHKYGYVRDDIVSAVFRWHQCAVLGDVFCKLSQMIQEWWITGPNWLDWGMWRLNMVHVARPDFAL